MSRHTLANRILKRAMAQAGVFEEPTVPSPGAYDAVFRRLEERLRPTPSPATTPDPPA